MVALTARGAVLHRMEYHEQLGLSRSEFEDVEDHFERRFYEGRGYRHLPDYRKSLERGTVLVAGEVVRGFPKIPRTLVLDPGVPSFFEASVVVEEKLNGYNVRVARIDGDLLAFTRSGIVCPFTTRAVVDDLDLDALFDDHPGLMLCGEVIGPESPYTSHDYPDVDSVAFRAFDLRDRESGEPVSVDDRRDRCEAYAIPQVPYHGRFDADRTPDELRTIVARLDEEGREGVVMKSPDSTKQLKYTTSATHRADLAHAFSLPFDYGREFVFKRVVREAFQAAEWNEPAEVRRERARELGEAILLPAVETIEAVEAGEPAGERHTVRADPATIDATLEHFRDLGLELEVEADRIEDGERVVTFVKRMRSTEDKTRAYLDGTTVDE